MRASSVAVDLLFGPMIAQLNIGIADEGKGYLTHRCRLLAAF